MTEQSKKEVNDFMAKVIAKNPGETEFHQAVKEVVESLMDYIDENPKYKKGKILERMVEPERVIMFRVPWLDDKGEIQINRGDNVYALAAKIKLNWQKQRRAIRNFFMLFSCRRH